MNGANDWSVDVARKGQREIITWVH